MRFHKLKLRNLNALYGEHSIDFERDVMGASVFLIVGPTGAGKSTLLDAICLALFGQTPRLERRTGKSETDVEHVMSIGTFECMAELDFSMVGADGTREVYRAVWSMRRAHEKADGTPQRPERSLHRIRNGALELLVSDHRQKFFEPVFNQALRDLSVEDFKRSILLAQGDFAAFLKASESEKASILERVTSTDVYLRLGKRAAERRREAEAKWREVEQRGAGIRVMGQDERRELEGELELKLRSAEELRELWKRAQVALELLRRYEQLQTELSKALEKRRLAEVAVEQVTGIRAKLALDASLSEIAHVVAALDELVIARSASMGEIEHLGETWEEMLKSGQEAESEWKTRRAQLMELSESWGKLEPRLRKAEELWNALELDQTNLKVLQTEIAQMSAERVAKQHVLEAFKVFEAEQKSIFEGHAKTLERLGEDEFRRIEAQWEAAIEPQVLQSKERTQAKERCQASLLSARKVAEEIEAKWQEKQGLLEPANRKVARATKHLETLTADHGGAAARDILENRVSGLQRKITSLREATTFHDQLKGWRKEQREVRERIAHLEGELKGLDEEVAREKTLYETLSQLQVSLEGNIRKSEQLLALSGLRSELSLGEPCPLCGSPVHPFCDSDELGLMDAELRKEAELTQEKLADVRSKTDIAREAIQRKSHGVTSKRTSLQHLEGRVVSIMGEVELLTRRFSQALLDAGYPPLEEYRLRDAHVLSEEIRIASEQFDAASAVHLQVKKALQALVEATQARDAVLEDEIVQKREAANLDVQHAVEGLRVAEAEFARAQEELEKRLGPVHEFARRFDHNVVATSDALRGFVESHRTKIAKVRQEIQGFENVRQTLEVRRTQATQLREELVSLESKIEERTRTLEVLRKVASERKDTLEEIVGTESPSMLRAQNEKALQLATQALEVSRRKKEATRASEERWLGQATSLRDRWKSLEEAWLKRRLELSGHLESLGMSEEAARLGILTEETRRDLERQVRAVELGMAHAEEGVKVLESQLAQLGNVETGDARREDLELEIATKEASLQDLTLSLGGIREKLSMDDQSRDALKGLREQTESAQRAMEVWTRVGGLIGVNEGASFREFAQTLNLQGLVQRANAQLENLHPRYHLVVAERDGLPTLQFDVVDRYQGDVRRPLTTLSGGESFLVSLALALGLAEFRSLDFPVEILLLDEGFGTLDQNALRMAVSTLHKLEARSAKQVAIISHVEALKEMVSVQIRVEPKGFGRSGLTVVR